MSRAWATVMQSPPTSVSFLVARTIASAPTWSASERSTPKSWHTVSSAAVGSRPTSTTSVRPLHRSRKLWASVAWMKATCDVDCPAKPRVASVESPDRPGRPFTRTVLAGAAGSGRVLRLGPWLVVVDCGAPCGGGGPVSFVLMPHAARATAEAAPARALMMKRRRLTGSRG